MKWQGRAMNVNMGSLVCFPRVQRYVNDGKAADMARVWCWAWLTPLIVVRRGRKYSVVDGQNRLLALRMAFPDYKGLLPCWVYPSMDEAKEARIMLHLNRNTPVSAADKYHVGLTAKDPAIVATHRVLRKAGIKPVYGPTTPGKNETRCAYAFVRAYRRLGADGLLRVVRCVKACKVSGGGIDPEALKASFVGGAVEYVARGRKVGAKRGKAGDILRRAGRVSLANGYKRAGAIADVMARVWK